MLPSPVRTALLLARHFEWILLVKTRNRSAHAYTGYTEHTLDTFSSNRAEFTMPGEYTNPFPSFVSHSVFPRVRVEKFRLECK